MKKLTVTALLFLALAVSVFTQTTFTSLTAASLGDGVYLLEDNTGNSYAVEVRLDAAQWTALLTRSGHSQTLQNITKTIYTKFNGDFDFIFFTINSLDENRANVNALGFHGQYMGISNDVQGIGSSTYPAGDSFGDSGKLKGIMSFPYYDAIRRGPALHEFAHAWAAHICDTYDFDNDRQYSHWGVSNAGGQLGGFNHIRTVRKTGDVTEYQASMSPETNPDGSFKYGGFGTFANGGNSVPYSDIELYLMGMISAEDLRAKKFRLDVYTGLGYEDTREKVGSGYFTATGITSYTIDDIIRLHGPRVPNTRNSQKRFKVLSVILSETRGAENTRHREIVDHVRWFAGESTSSGVYNFNQATRGVGSLEVGGLAKSLRKSTVIGERTIIWRNRIGERGPGGGIIFYDKGSVTDGWRYLEAAPAETEFTAAWGPDGKEMPETELAIGSGRKNTRIIADRLKQLGETGRAAQLCDGLEYNGYTDWFLPSYNELILMIKTLSEKGLGGFEGWYWSSSSEQYDGVGYVAAFDYKDSSGNRQLRWRSAVYKVRAVRAF